MSVLRLTRMTPDIYSQESRDFQLLCRIYDCVINGIKWDGDSTLKSIDTHNCRGEMLELLQTKLGFFTTKSFTTDELRAALEAFPSLIKRKGSLKAVLGAINTFLHTLHISTTVEIWCTKEATKIGSHTVKDHTLIIGIQATVSDTTLLEEIFRYILPAGYDFYIYYYLRQDVVTKFLLQERAKLLFISEEAEAEIANEDNDISAIIGQVDDIMISTESPQNLATRPGQFRGVVSSLPSAEAIGDTVILESDLGTNVFYYVNTSLNWTWRRFRGCYTDLSLVQSPVYRDVVIIDNPNSNNYYFNVSAGSGTLGKYRGAYASTSLVTSPSSGDIISIHKSTKIEWYVYYNSVWTQLNNVMYVRNSASKTAASTLYIVRDYLVYARSDSSTWSSTGVFTPAVYFPINWTGGELSDIVIVQELVRQLTETNEIEEEEDE